MAVTAISRLEVTDVVGALSGALAQTMVETAKAQTFHWNVKGMAFGPLHALFQEIYEDHFAAQDRLAERIKALGGHADGRLSNALESSSIVESSGEIPASEMVAQLASEQHLLSENLRRLASIAEENDDVVTNDIAIERADAHDKFAWMLDAHFSDA